MKSFLILQHRYNDIASDGEYEAFLKHGGMSNDQTRRVRMEQNGLPGINLDDYSGVIIGGGPSNVSDDEEKKTDAQKKFENQLSGLMSEIVSRDFPYLGVCYGLGALVQNQEGEVSKEKYAEDVGALAIKLNKDGENDPLLSSVPKEFRAFAGHKESCQRPPEGAVVLAGSETCPFQMIRIKNNVYATQFHPELDVEGMIVRIDVYKNAGYFPPEDAKPLIEKIKNEDIFAPGIILKNFIERYSR